MYLYNVNPSYCVYEEKLLTIFLHFTSTFPEEAVLYRFIHDRRFVQTKQTLCHEIASDKLMERLW